MTGTIEIPKSAGHEKREAINAIAAENPQAGDYWHEMFAPYFMVVDVRAKQITVLSCMGGEDSFGKRKHEPNAQIQVNDGWYFDVTKSFVVDKDWIKKAVKYESIDAFVATCVRGREHHMEVVQEWRKHNCLDPIQTYIPATGVILPIPPKEDVTLNKELVHKLVEECIGKDLAGHPSVIAGYEQYTMRMIREINDILNHESNYITSKLKERFYV